MRFLLILLLATASLAQQLQPSHTTESLRGVSAVSNKIAWASGTHGTYLRTTDGQHWTPAQVPNAMTLDFRGIVAFSVAEAFLMSSGPGDQSRIYHTTDAGQHWQLQSTASNPKSFFDSIAFWDKTHGIVLGDPVPDESGKLKFQVLLTDDGQTWHAIPSATLPAAVEGEGAFAASNSCIAIVPTPSNPVILSGDVRSATRIGHRSRRTPTLTPPPAASQGVSTTASLRTIAFANVRKRKSKDASKKQYATPNPNIWFATGGKVARVFHSPDGGHSWQVAETPITHGPDSAGIFSIAFRDQTHGVIAGGDYKHPDQDGPNLAFTNDGGKTWTLASPHPQPYFSAVAYDRKDRPMWGGRHRPPNAGSQERLFIVASDVVFDYRPPRTLSKIGSFPNAKFNALSPYPEGGALVVGPNGTIFTIPSSAPKGRKNTAHGASRGVSSER
jgi:photosystem II stability/assembly factor-like uncharacterized protein